MKFELKRLEPVQIHLQGKSYPAKLTNRALIELEEFTGVSHIEFLARLDGTSTNIKDISTLLFVALKGGGVEVEYSDLLELDFAFNEYVQLLNALGEVVSRSLTTTGNDKDEKKRVKRGAV